MEVKPWSNLAAYKSESNEDQMVFDYYSKGRTVVDVGAADGITGSNSYRLISELGWRGYLVEPEPYNFSVLREVHKDNSFVTTINKAVSDKEEDKTLYVKSKRGEHSLKENFRSHDKVDEVVVKCDTLTNILNEAGCPTNIDFLSIDCEEYDLIALKSLDYNIYTVQLLCIEFNTDGEEKKKFVEENLPFRFLCTSNVPYNYFFERK